MNNRLFYFLPAVCWLIASIVLLTLPGSAFPQENWLDKVWADKWIHIVMFGLLVVLWCRALYKSAPQTSLKNLFILVAILALVYGAGMEFVQKNLVPNRSFDLKDIVGDGVGCVLGWYFSQRSYIKK